MPPSPPPAAWPGRPTSPAAVLALLALWLLATMGLRPLMLPDEGRYSDVARQMLAGDGLTPLLNGLPFFHKPPLMYWIDMAAMSVFGVNPFAARFAPFVGAWLMGAALFLALRRSHGPSAARWALAVLATSPYFFLGAQYANHDMLVAGLISVSVLSAVRALDDPARRSLHWVVAAWVAAALAVLAKGLIGIVLPALVVGPWLLAQRRWREMLRLLHPLGIVAGLAVAAPWFVAMHFRYPGFSDYFFMEQHFRRFSQASFNNPQPFWYFIVVLPVLTFPWSLWLWPALRRLARERSASLGLYAWWTVAVIGFFSIPHSKLMGYGLPAVAPFCALLALSLAPGRATRRVLGAAALMCVGIVLFGAWQAPKSTAGGARALAAQIQPGERVVFVDDYFFDLPFVARLRQPVIVALDWADPKLPVTDNWRKELYDAARFDPALGRELLWPRERLSELVCHGHAVWFAARPANTNWHAEVPGIEPVYADDRVQVLRAPASSCP